MLIGTLLRTWRQNWQQVLFVISGIISGVAGLAAVLIINETAKQKIDGLNNTLTENVYAIARLNPGNTFTKAQYTQLRSNGLEVVAGARFHRVFNGHSVNFLALDSAAMLNIASLQRIKDYQTRPARQSFNFVTNKEQNQLNLFTPFTSPALYKELTSTFTADDFAPYQFPVASPLVKEDLIYMSLAQASVLPEPLNLNELWIIAEPQKEDIEQLEAAGFALQFIEFQQSNITASFHINIFAMGGLMLAVSLFVVLNAYNLLLSGRHTFVKQLYVLGISLNKLRMMFLLEAWFWASLCIVAGFLSGQTLAEFLSPGVKQTLEGLYDVNFSEAKSGIFAIKLQITLITITAVSLAIVFPLNQMLKRLSLDFSQSEQGDLNRTRRINSMVTAILFVLLMVIWPMSEQSLLMSFVVIVHIVLFGCFATISFLPGLIAYIKTVVPEKRPIPHYFASDAVRLSHRNSIAFCAFFIAITANIGMNLMVDSFRQATQSWLAQQFVADFYIGTDSPEKIRQWQNQTPDLVIYEREKANIRLHHQKTELIALPETGIESLNLVFKESDTSADFSQSNTVFVNEQLALRTQLQTGDTLTIKNQTLRIKGIYYDYGNMHNQVVADVGLVRSLQTRTPARHLFSVSGIKTDSENTSLNEFIDFLDNNDIRYFTGENIRNISVSIFDQTFVITSVLNIVTLLVAGISLATSIIIVSQQNRHHYITLRQLGVQAVQIQTANFVQYFYIVTLLFFCAVPFGLLLSWLLIHKINYLSFFWTYPMVINLWPLVTVYLMAVATVLICLLLSFSLDKSEKEIIAPGMMS